MREPPQQETLADAPSVPLSGGFSEPVWRWRFEYALRLGFAVAEAALLALERLDLHEVESLIRRGCEPALALRILR